MIIGTQNENRYTGFSDWTGEEYLKRKWLDGRWHAALQCQVSLGRTRRCLSGRGSK